MRDTMRTSARLIGALMVALAASSVQLAAAAEAQPSPTPSTAPAPAIWEKHEYQFTFMGFTSTYSCDGLASKLQLLLITSGARKDAKATPNACVAGFGQPDKLAQAHLVFYTLSPLAVAAAGSAAAPEGAQPVSSSWRTVAITLHHPRDLGIGDCEVVEQFRSAVLPMFNTRNVQDRTTCVPHQESGSNVDLTFDVLTTAR